MLFCQTEIRRLSRSRVSDRVVNLSKEIAVFLLEAGHKAAEKFEDVNFLLMLCYLADIFGFLNEINLSLKRSNANQIVCFQKVHAFMNKLPMWKNECSREIWPTSKCLMKSLRMQKL